MNTRKVMKIGWFHIRTFLKGFVRTLDSALVIGAAAGSIYGFTLVTSETGYTAVVEFVASCVLLVIALVGIYASGQQGRCYKKDKGCFAKEVK